jgi:uracil phosphoribosyltransferase
MGLESCPAGSTGGRPDVPLDTAAPDRARNDHGYILPGQADAGGGVYGMK